MPKTAPNPYEVIVVLGCRVPARGLLGGTAARRAERAAQAYFAGLAPLLVTSGGKTWHGRAEAHAFKDHLIALGVPEQDICCELRSMSTRGNARHVAELCRAREVRRIAIVTCDWHMARALRAFARHGFAPAALPARTPEPPRHRAYTEVLQSLLDGALFRLERRRAHRPAPWLLCASLAVLSASIPSGACQRQPSGAESEARATPSQLRSSDPLPRTRAAKPPIDSPLNALEAEEVEWRRAAARALISAPSDAELAALLSALADEDGKVLSSVAFALGRHCAGREDVVVRALALRAASLLAASSAPQPSHDPEVLEVLARALGGCESREAERALVSLLDIASPGAATALATGAALGLGDLGARRGNLDEASYLRLLEAATRKEAPVATALYLFSRVTPADPEISARAAQVARQALKEPGELRQFALRSLARAGDIATLAEAARDPSVTPLERAAIARELAQQTPRSTPALMAWLRELLLPALASPAPSLTQTLDIPSLITLLEALPSLPSPEPAIERLLGLTEAPPDTLTTSSAWNERLLGLRCAAARLLAGGDWLHAALAACSPESRAGKLTRLLVVDRGRFVGARRDAYLMLAQDPDPLVRQTALRLAGKHRELTNLDALMEAALKGSSLGVLAAAAELASQHPSRVSLPLSALSEALDEAWNVAEKAQNPGVLAAIIDAVAALSAVSLLPRIERACENENPTLRRHAERALSTLGQGTHRCRAKPSRAGPAALHVEPLAAGPITIDFETDVGKLDIQLDSELAPTAVRHIASLVRTGFYDGVVVHRQVPGFAVQFGDPTGEGYGGDAGPALPSEFAPGRFRSYSVGLAENGEGTGKSQLFVLFTEAPHLDGANTRLGRASPGWERLRPGDRILHARVR